MKKYLPISRNQRSVTVFSRVLRALLLIVLLFCWNDRSAGAGTTYKGRTHLKAKGQSNAGVGNVTRPGLNTPAINKRKSGSLAGPTISYSSPQTYLINAAITPLAPTSSGVSTPGYSSSTTNVYGIALPEYAAVDASGNLYISTANKFGVEKIPKSGGSPIFLGNNLIGVAGIAVNGRGDVYMAAYNQNEIVEVPAGGTQIIVATGFNAPSAVAVDSAGNVYVADTANNLVKEVPAGGGATVTLGSGFNDPEGIAVDGAGNVYVADFGNSAVKMIPAGNGVPVTIGSGFIGPWGIAVDPEGNVFVGDNLTGSAWELPAGGGAQVQLTSGFNHAQGISVDGAGNLYIADAGNNEIKELNPVGGYFINAIPPGLSFNNTTGVLSGTPTTARLSTNYTLTAYNSSGSASAVLSIVVNALAFSYSSPQSYAALSAITPLAPVTNGAVAAAAFNNAPVTLASGFGQARGVASDAAGNIYVADETNRLINEIPAGGGTPVTIASGLNLPQGIAVDAAGNIYVADGGNSTIQKIPAGGGAIVNMGSGFFDPTGVAVDAAGNVYVADSGNNAVKEIFAGAGNTITLGTGFDNPVGIAVDAAGNVYIANTGSSSTVQRIPPGGGTPVTLGSGFANPYDVAIDPAGNVYVADEGHGALKMIPAAGGAPVSIGSGYAEPAGVAIDPFGDVLAADQNLNTVTLLKPLGGYYLNKFLPSGLTFNNGTGVISGTPAVTSPATNYTVTAYNAGGSNSATVTINVVNTLSVSYNSPQDYSIGTTVTPLSPTGSGVAAAAFNGAPVTLAAGFGQAHGIASDAAGNIYVADQTNRLIKKIPAGGGTAVTIASGLNLPQGIAVDAAGNIYVAASNSTIQKIPAAGGAIVNIGSGFFAPAGVAVDAAGNVYVADSGNNAIKEILANGGGTITLGTGFDDPNGIAVDAAGNIYVANSGSSSTVQMIPPGGGTPVTLGSGFANPYDVAVDPAGNIYVADEGHSALKIIPAGGGAPVSIGSGYAEPAGVAIDPFGDVLAADQDLNTVTLLKPLGGYYLNKFLPSGLTFNNGTGIFAGTPAVTSPATNYTVTAYNGAGGNPATVNITVNPFPLSYNSPQTYVAGVAITPLAPASSGVAAAGYSFNAIPLGTNAFNSPSGVTADAAGNVYVADTKNNKVKKLPAGGGAPVAIGSGFSNPIGIAVDAVGNVYVGDQGNSAVKKIPVGGGSPVSIGSGFSGPYGVAVDGAGNVYVADFGHGAIKEILAATGATLTIASGFAAPCGVAVDAAGNVYVADAESNAVGMIPAGGGPPVTIGSGFVRPTGVAVDASGNLFVADPGNVHVEEIAAGTNTPVILNSGEIFGVGVDGAGNVYAAENINASQPVFKIPPVGGYYIGPFLPANLRFNNNTGVVSGTPTVASPATNYTITAYGQSGTSSKANLTITVNLPPLPAISYHGPQNYTLNKAITALSPSNTGGAVAAPAYNTLPVVIGSGFSSPAGIAIDAAGNVYVADYGNNDVKEAPAGGGAPVIIGSGFANPSGVAVDAAGNVYVADNGNNAVKKIPFTGGSYGAPVTLGSGFSTPFGVALDASGNVYVSDAGNAAVKKIPAGGGTPVVIGTGFGYPAGLAVDAAGNVYVTDEENNVVDKIPAGGGTPVTIATGFKAPTGVAADVFGNLYVADLNNGALKKIPLTNGSYGDPFVFGLAVVFPLGVAIDGGGNVFMADFGDNTVKEFKETGGYYISPGLPAGLIFSGTTGAIHGTPTAKSPATNYTVTAYNLAGTVNAQVNISVTPDDNLSSLKMSKGIFSPTFAAGTTSYTDAVGNTITSVTVTPATSDPAATVKVNGTTVPSGTASAAINLNVGPNTITTVVTASDGATIKTYTVTVTRAGNSNDNLTSLKMSKGIFSPAFASGTTGYADAVGNTITSVTVTPTASDPDATIKVNGTIVPSGTASGAINLAVGPNTVTTVVTASDGATIKTYTVTVTRAGNSNDNLTSLKMSKGVFSPAFASGTTSYADAVGNTITSATVTPTASDPDATIKVNGTTVPSGTASAAINLNVGPNTITTVVTASDGATIKTYTVTVTRAGNSNDNLTSLKMSKGIFSPAFASGTTGYADAVGNTITSVTVTPTASDPDATIKVNGTIVPSGTASGAINLRVGANTVTTVVTASDGATTKTYTVTVTRAGNSNDNLSSLKMSKGVFSPTFASGTVSYADAVGNTISSVTVTPAASDLDATIKVNGTTVASGTASGAINLAVGPNTINVAVKASDGVTTKTYTVTVTRASGGSDSYDPGISVAKPSETATLTEDGIKVHQGVSPNGDGINDFLVIDNISQYPNNRLSIMNRNGQLIYEASGYDNSSKVFDGHSSKNGQMQLPGTYFYQLDYTLNGITKHKTGFLVLKY